MRRLISYKFFEYKKAELSIQNERLLFYENDTTLIMYFSLWKMIDVASIDDIFLAVSFDNGSRAIINFIKEKNKSKILEALEEVLKKRKRYFSTIPFTIMDFKDIGTSMDFLFKIYSERKFPLPRPKIWGKIIPPFYEKLDVFRYDTLVKKNKEEKLPIKVKRRKSIKTLLTLDLDEILETENAINQAVKSPEIKTNQEKFNTTNNEIIPSLTMDDNNKQSKKHSDNQIDEILHISEDHIKIINVEEDNDKMSIDDGLLSPELSPKITIKDETSQKPNEDIKKLSLNTVTQNKESKNHLEFELNHD